MSTTFDPTNFEDLEALAEYLSGFKDKEPARVDCFFVTLAVLLGTTVEELAKQLNMEVPQPGTRGVEPAVIVKAIKALGMRIKMWTYTEPSGVGPIRPVRDEAQGVPEAQAVVSADMPHVVGVAYWHPVRKGHVVVCKAPGKPYRRYLDYQASRAGTDVTDEVRASKICMMFGFDMQGSTGTYFEKQREAIAKLEVEAKIDKMEM